MISYAYLAVTFASFVGHTIVAASTHNVNVCTTSDGDNDSDHDLASFVREYGYKSVIPHVTDTINKTWMIKQLQDTENGLISKFNFILDESSISGDDWFPTPHGWMLAEAIEFNPKLANIISDSKVLELGSGVGIHTILIAQKNPSKLYVTEITESRLEITRNTMEINKQNGKIPKTFDIDKNMTYIIADWLHIDSLKEDNNNNKFDVIISNPPFAASGKRNRKYFIDELILNSGKYLIDNGYLIFVQSSMADIEDTILNLEKNKYYNIEIILAKSYYWRDYYFNDETFLDHCDSVQNKTNGKAFKIEEGGKRVEMIYVLIAQLSPYQHSTIAH